MYEAEALLRMWMPWSSQPGVAVLEGGLTEVWWRVVFSESFRRSFEVLLTEAGDVTVWLSMSLLDSKR